MDELLFTPASILDLLSQIEELQNVDVGIHEHVDGVDIQVGQLTYTISSKDATEIHVNPHVLDIVDDVNTDTYQNLQDSNNMIVYDGDEEPIEGGIIKQLAKTLFVGGLVRLTAKMLKK